MPLFVKTPDFKWHLSGGSPERAEERRIHWIFWPLHKSGRSWKEDNKRTSLRLQSLRRVQEGDHRSQSAQNLQDHRHIWLQTIEASVQLPKGWSGTDHNGLTTIRLLEDSFFTSSSSRLCILMNSILTGSLSQTVRLIARWCNFFSHGLINARL